jgi:hypothetical protein
VLGAIEVADQLVVAAAVVLEDEITPLDAHARRPHGLTFKLRVELADDVTRRCGYRGVMGWRLRTLV